MVEGRACSGSVACDAAGGPQFCGSGRGAGFPENRSISRVVVAGLHVGAIAVQLFWVGRKLRWARVWTRPSRRCVKGWPPWKQEFNDAGISGYGSTDGCDHFLEDNPYGHPSPELLERLEASGARVLRTDRDGAVYIVTDGDRLEISCFVACAESPTVTTSRRAEMPNQNQNNQQ